MIDRINNLDSEKAKKAFADLLKNYLNPAFGSISKRDFDILLFTKLQELELISMNPDLYELVTQLKVTRSKARNLLYESKLRKTSTSELDDELKNLLKTPIFLKDNDKIGIEIDNPFLIDHLRAKLKKLNHITDGSFSPELVKLTTDAYIALFEAFLPENSIREVKDAFINIDALPDKSFKGILKGALKKLGSKIADEAGGKIAEEAGEYLGPLISGGFTTIKDKFVNLISDNT